MEHKAPDNSLTGDRAAFPEDLEDPVVFRRICRRLILSCNLRAKAYLRSGLSVEYQHNRQCADVLTKLLRERERRREDEKSPPPVSPPTSQET